MKCLFLIFVLLSVVSAQLGCDPTNPETCVFSPYGSASRSLIRPAAQLGDECTVGADCGRGQDLICVHGKCIRLQSARASLCCGSLDEFCDPTFCHNFIARRSPQQCGATFCGTGFICRAGRCIFHPVSTHFFGPPCPVPCAEFGKVCVRGVCQ